MRKDVENQCRMAEIHCKLGPGQLAAAQLFAGPAQAPQADPDMIKSQGMVFTKPNEPG